MYEEIKAKLEKYPLFRERKYRYKYILVMALRELGYTHIKLGDKMPQLSEDSMIDFAIRFDSYRHAWTDVTKDCKELRGKDYDDKKMLEQKKQIELGYSPGYHQDIAKLKTLT